MEQPPPGPAPTDAYQWRESVLSTRSLSYISTVPDDNDLPTTPRRSFARNPSYGFPNISHTRRNTLMSISSLGEDEQDEQDEQEEEEEGLEIRPRQQHAPNSNKKRQNQTTTNPDAKTTSPPQQEPSALPPSIAKSPLYTLPLELRQLIWSYALSPSAPSLEIPWPSTHLTAHLHPSLLRTCHAIHAESARILYTTTNLSFSHPSDCNIFVRALASPLYAPLLPHFTLRIRSADLKLWTSYFNSHAKERSLVRDYPWLRGVSVRYSGLRYERRYTEEQNAHLWLKDPRLQELVLSVRKCSGDGRAGTDRRGGGRVGGLDARIARGERAAGVNERTHGPSAATEGAVGATENGVGTLSGPPVIRVALCVVVPQDVLAGLTDGRIDPKLEAERCNAVIFLREAWLLGCYIRVECVEKEGLWR